MHTGLPDADALGLPGFNRSDAARFERDARDVAAATRAGVLDHGHRMQIDDARLELTIFLRRRRVVLIFPLALRRIVERPVLHFTLAALHDDAAHGVVALAI